MKKLMVAAAVAFAAAITQAATVQWGGAIATPDNSDTLPAGTQAALLWSASEFTGAATSLASWTVGATANNGGTLVKTYTLTKANEQNWAFSATYATEGSVDGYYAVLVLNETGDYASYYDIGSVTGTSGTSATTDKLVNYDWDDDNTYLTSGGYTVSVPEPTSGLLMLLGFAGLALRRKRA